MKDCVWTRSIHISTSILNSILQVERSPADGVIDIDADKSDPVNVCDYAHEIFVNMKRREVGLLSFWHKNYVTATVVSKCTDCSDVALDQEFRLSPVYYIMATQPKFWLPVSLFCSFLLASDQSQCKELWEVEFLWWLTSTCILIGQFKWKPLESCQKDICSQTLSKTNEKSHGLVQIF